MAAECAVILATSRPLNYRIPSEWDPENANEETGLYFSQEEEGNMDQSVTLFELEIEIPA